jgi:alpha-mannosidase
MQHRVLVEAARGACLEMLEVGLSRKGLRRVASVGDVPGARMTVASGSGTVPRVSMIGNAHIDPVWIWDWHEGMHEVLHTFRSALDRLDEDPGLTFCASSSAFYEWVEEVDPPLFARIRQAVVSGRWVVVGGQWVEPDCNIPTGESVCRQFLYGQRYLSSRFGTTATVGWNIDAFGHAGSLPQILVAAGLSSYVMMRPDENEKDIPSPLFTWSGSDGTSLPTYRVPFHYATDDFGEEAQLRERAEALLERSEGLGIPLMCLFGVGNHGGGPTRAALHTIREISAQYGGRIRLDAPDEYFARVAVDELPAVTGDLQWHAVGCYSARAEVKRRHSAAEQALVVAEKVERICRFATGDELTGTQILGRSWRSLLFSEFHDALGGTCTERSNEGIDLMVAEARAGADRVTTLALHTLARHVDTWTEGADRAEGLQASALGGLPIPLLVVNPLSWAITATVSVPYPIAACTDHVGDFQPLQHAPSGEVTFSPTRTLLQLPLPAMGYRRFWLHATGTPRLAAPVDSSVARREEDGCGHAITNSLLDVGVDAVTGVVHRLVDRRTGRQWLAAEGIRCVVLDDASDTWSHGTERYDGTESAWTCEGIDVVEDGPVRATVRGRFHFETSTLTQEVSLYSGQSFVDLHITIDWHGRHQLVKLVVPLQVREAQCAAGAPYGVVERTVCGHEDPMIHWVDVSERDGEGGVTCTAAGTHGYDAYGGRLRLTLLRSPRVADHGRGWGADDPDGYPYLDQGVHDFHFRLHPHQRGWRDATPVRWSEEHLLEPPMVLDTWHRGTLGPSASVLRVSEGSAVVSAMKRAESGAGSVLRIWESRGRPTRAVVVLGPAAWEANMGPHQVMTVFVPDDTSAPLRTIDLCEFTAEPTDVEDP